MIACTPAAIAARKGASSTSRSSSRVAEIDRQPEVGVDHGGAVAREVLGAGCDPTLLQASHEGGDVARDEQRIGPERAHADDGIERVGVDVGDRREVVRDPDGTELVGERPRDPRREPDVVDRAEREVSGHRASARRLETRDVAALLVDRDDRALGHADRRRQPLQLLGVAHVAAEEHHAPEAIVELSGEPGRHGDPAEPGQDARTSESVECPAHPRTAPAVSPNAMRRCTRRKNTITGIAVNVEAAIRPPQSVFRLVP